MTQHGNDVTCLGSHVTEHCDHVAYHRSRVTQSQPRDDITPPSDSQ